MRLRIWGLLASLLAASSAFGANNAVIVTVGSGLTMCSKDIGSGVQAMCQVLVDTSGVPIYGTAGAANANVLTVQGIASGTPVIVSGTITANLGTLNGAATAANQTTGNSSLATIANNTGTYLGGFSTAQTSAAANNLVAKASAGDIISISGSGASGSFIMLFDATSAPVDGAVTPKKCWGPLAAAGPFVFAWGAGPVIHNSTGITVVSSSTGCFTKTGTNAPFISVEYN